MNHDIKAAMRIIKEETTGKTVRPQTTQMCERLQNYAKENKVKDDQLVEVEFVGHTLSEAFINSEDVSDETRLTIEKMRKKYGDVIFSVFSESNRVTQNLTFYSFDALNEAITDSEFKRRKKNREIVMHIDHPSWWEGVADSVLNIGAVLREVFWEEVEGDPTGRPTRDIAINPEVNKSELSTSRPAPRLFGVFKIFGQHKEHLLEYAKEARLGISSRGYGMSETIYDDKDRYLFSEIYPLELNTWDFVTRPSVKKASFTLDGELNPDISDDDDTEMSTESIESPENLSEEFEKPELETDTLNVNPDEDSATDEEKEQVDPVITEEMTMNKEQILEALSTTIGKEVVAEIIKSNNDSTKVEEELKTLTDANEHLKTQCDESKTQLDAVKAEKAELETSNQAMTDQIQTHESEKAVVLKDAFISQWNEATSAKLVKDLEGCETVEAITAKIALISPYLPESLKKDHQEPNLGEQLESTSVESETTEEIPAGTSTEDSVEEHPGLNESIKQAKLKIRL